jgi:hypothetical protein
MKKILFTIAIVLGLINYSYAQVKFQKTYGGSGDDVATACARTNDGGYVIGGYTTSFGNGDKDSYVIKLDELGNIQWSKIFGGPGDDEISSILQTFNGNYLIRGFSDNAMNSFITKMSISGEILFTKTHINSDVGIFTPKAIQTSDNNYITLSTTGDISNLHMELIKFDTLGNILWQNSFGWAFGGGIAELSNGDLIIVGAKYGSNMHDFLLIKTTSFGTLIWSKTIGTVGNDGGYNIIAMESGNFFVSGSSLNNPIGIRDFIFFETDENGNVIWANRYGEYGKDYHSNSAISVSDNGFITEINEGQANNGSNMGLLKTDSLGNVLWSKKYGGLLEDNCNSVVETNDGGFLLVGYTNSFGSGSKDIYIVKTDNFGNSGCYEIIGGIQSSNWNYITSSISIDTFTPVTRSNSTFPESPVTTLDSALCTTVGINEIKSDNEFKIFPNPGNSNFQISLGVKLDYATIEIYNTTGEKVFQERIYNTMQKEINLNNITAGIYFVKVISDKKYMCSKLIVE